MIRNLPLLEVTKIATIRSTTTVSLPLLKDCVLNLKLYRWLPQRKSRFGRTGFSSISLFLALLLKIREHIQYDTALVRKLKENVTYRHFCGFGKDHIPSHDTFSRFNRKLTQKRLQTIVQKIDNYLVQEGAFLKDELSLDATDVLSNGRNKHNLDPEAGFGYKSDKERFHGYWAQFVTGSRSEMIRAVQVSPANVHQSMTAQRLFDDLESRDLCNATLLTSDSACDDKKSYHRCVQLQVIPLIDYNPKNSKTKQFFNLPQSDWRKRCLGNEGIRLRQKYYYQRMSVERYNSSFKEILQGRTVPVRGLKKVTKYVLLTCILSQLYGVWNWYHQVYSTPLVQTTLLSYLN